MKFDSRFGINGSISLFGLLQEKFSFLVFLDGEHVYDLTSFEISENGYVNVSTGIVGVNGQVKQKRLHGDVKLVLRDKKSGNSYQLSKLVDKGTSETEEKSDS